MAMLPKARDLKFMVFFLNRTQVMGIGYYLQAASIYLRYTQTIPRTWNRESEAYRKEPLPKRNKRLYHLIRVNLRL